MRVGAARRRRPECARDGGSRSASRRSRRPRLDRLDRVLHRGVRRHQDELDVRIALLDVAEQLDAAHARHPHVGEDQVDRRLAHQVERRRSTIGRRDREIALGQEQLQNPTNVGIVLDHQDAILITQRHPPSQLAWHHGRVPRGRSSQDACQAVRHDGTVRPTALGDDTIDAFDPSADRARAPAEASLQ